MNITYRGILIWLEDDHFSVVCQCDIPGGYVAVVPMPHGLQKVGGDTLDEAKSSIDEALEIDVEGGDKT